MVKLIETHNIAKSAPIRFGKDGQRRAFVGISAIGDGNCGPYVLALALIDQIKLGHQFNPALINEFYQAMRDSIPLLRERIKLYRGQPNAIRPIADPVYPDLADPLENIVKFIEANESLETDDFYHFVAHFESRHNIAALQVAMGPALRAMGSFAHRFSLDSLGSEASEEERRDADDIAEDGIEIGHECLVPLAHRFGLNVTLYDWDVKDGQGRIRNATVTDTVIPGAPYIHLTHKSNHWYYFMPADQRGGLACLPDVNPQPVREKQTGNLAQQIHQASEVLARRAETLLPTDENPLLPSALTILEVAKESNETTEKLRQQLQLSREKLASLPLRELEKDIILDVQSHSGPASSDEALARSLQNAEIVAFFDRNYQALTQGRIESRQQPEEATTKSPPPSRRNV